MGRPARLDRGADMTKTTKPDNAAAPAEGVGTAYRGIAAADAAIRSAKLGRGGGR